jgi:hypothetical protein
MLAPIERLRNYLFQYNAASDKKPLRIGIFSSDAGYNTLDLLNLQDELAASGQHPFKICFFFSDNADFRNYSNYYKGQSSFYDKLNPSLKTFDIRDTLAICGIPHATVDIDEFYQKQGYLSKNDKNIPAEKRKSLRDAYFEVVEKILVEFESENGPIDMIVNDTFLSIISGKTLQRKILNCHWGDLTRSYHGKRIYTGYHGFLQAMQNGDTELYSTAHFVNGIVDGGKIILRSRPLKIDYQLSAEFGFPFKGLTDKEVVDFLNDPVNSIKAVELETFFEALIRLTIDSDTLVLSTLAVSKNFFESGGVGDFFSRYGIHDGISEYLAVI